MLRGGGGGGGGGGRGGGGGGGWEEPSPPPLLANQAFVFIPPIYKGTLFFPFLLRCQTACISVF